MLAQEEARELLDAIDTSTLVGLRDRPLIASMISWYGRQEQGKHALPFSSKCAGRARIEVRPPRSGSAAAPPRADGLAMEEAFGAILRDSKVAAPSRKPLRGLIMPSSFPRPTFPFD